MRKLQKAAAAAAMIGTLSLISTGTATAQGAHGMRGGGGCESHDMNIVVLGNVGIANGIAGNLLNGEGDAGSQEIDLDDC